MNELGQSVASAHNQNESNNELTMSRNSSPSTPGSKVDVGLLAHEHDAEIEGRIKNFLENNEISVMITADAKIPGDTRTQMPFRLADSCRLVLLIATPSSINHPGYSRYYANAGHHAALKEEERNDLPKTPFHVLRPLEHHDISIPDKLDVSFPFVENDSLVEKVQQMLRELRPLLHHSQSNPVVDNVERNNRRAEPPADVHPSQSMPDLQDTRLSSSARHFAFSRGTAVDGRQIPMQVVSPLNQTPVTADVNNNSEMEIDLT
ncbi:unnamed protein product [Clavelina lepadiformis]|uniref:TIR domain-containing protein n=1 Tax=Clavelina lepadiformis TaxID=159417 RepID=A0ABP0GSG7_CLALP